MNFKLDWKDSKLGTLPDQTTIRCEAPSNIALVKYWGKKPIQLPQNPSISFTLSACKTCTTLIFTKKKHPKIEFDFYFDGNVKIDFNPKIQQFLNRISPYVPWLQYFKLVIDSTNTFPHSSGIASSASSMAALAYAIVAFEKQIDPRLDGDLSIKKASFLARLGSGSACRSLHGSLMVWGKHEDIHHSSDYYAVPWKETLSPVFETYQDTILFIDSGQKKISSSIGHGLMHGHPYAYSRFDQANRHIGQLKNILQTGDLDRFITLVESEALSLHAMMMTSTPYFMLLQPNTLSVIQKIWKYRADTGSQLCFTLDAGANIHLLYPESEKDAILYFITHSLLVFCEQEQYICDCVGKGAKIL